MSAKLKPIGPDDPDLGALSPEQFEDLVFLLAHAEDAGVVPIRAKDQGLDARLPAAGGRATAWGWQAKRFTRGINWEECRTSIRRAKAFWRPIWMTFCFPRELSAIEQAAFVSELVEQSPGLTLDFWSGKELKRRMRASEEGRRAAEYFFGDPTALVEAMRRVATVGGELNAADQALARLDEINQFLQRDPHFDYEIGLTNPDAPQSTPRPGTIVSLDLEVEKTRIRLNASERYPGAAAERGPRGALVFDNEAAAKRAREELDRIGREGGTAELGPGTRVRMDRVPDGLSELLPEEMSAESVEVTALPGRPGPRPRSVPILVAAGEIEAVVDFSAVDPPTGWNRAIQGGFGGLDITMLIRQRKGQRERYESRMDWEHKMGVGPTMEQLASLELVATMYAGAAVQLYSQDKQALLTEATGAEQSAGPDMEGVEARLELLRALAEVEAWTGEQLEPPPNWRQEDAQAVYAALGVVREPFREDIEGIRVELTYRPEAMPDEPAELHQFAVVQELAINLFGQEIPLGKQMIHLPKGRITEIDESDLTAVVVPASGVKGSIRVFPPRMPAPFDRRDIDEGQSLDRG